MASFDTVATNVDPELDEELEQEDVPPAGDVPAAPPAAGDPGSPIPPLGQLPEVESTAEQPGDFSATNEQPPPSIDDGGEYIWVREDDGSFRCVDGPGGPNGPGVGNTSSPGDPTYDLLVEIWDREFPGGGETAGGKRPTGDGDNKDGEGGGLFDLLPELPSLPDFPDIPNPLDLLRDMGSAAWKWIAGDDSESGDTSESSDPDQCEIVAPGVPGKRDNLDVALELANDEDLKINYKKKGSKSDLKKAIAGKGDEMDNINCGQFTALTLAEAGWDLNEPYLHGGDTPVGYLDAAKDPDGNDKITFVQLWMLVNHQREANVAVMNASGGTASLVTIGDDVDVKLTATNNGGPKPAAGSYYFSQEYNAQMAGRDPAATDTFGVAAAVLSMGGREVESADRKPSDLQQRNNINADGSYGFDGHSSQVFEVTGVGVCYHDPANEATPRIDLELEPGWYDNTSGGPEWRLGPATAPCNVSSFAATDFKLVDANKNRGNDAIKTGSDRNIEEKEKAHVYSIGRLPTSKWFDWPTSKPKADNPKTLPLAND